MFVYTILSSFIPFLLFIEIIKYNNAHDILIEFQDDHKTKVNIQYSKFKNGGVKNPFHPSVYGIGYLGEGKYNTKAV